MVGLFPVNCSIPVSCTMPVNLPSCKVRCCRLAVNKARRTGLCGVILHTNYTDTFLATHFFWKSYLFNSTHSTYNYTRHFHIWNCHAQTFKSAPALHVPPVTRLRFAHLRDDERECNMEEEEYVVFSEDETQVVWRAALLRPLTSQPHGSPDSEALFVCVRIKWRG